MKRPIARAAAPSHGDNDDGNAKESPSIGGPNAYAEAEASLQGIRAMVFKALSLPFLVILQETGRSGMLVLSVGGIVCYMLDLLQVPEVSRPFLSLLLA